MPLLIGALKILITFDIDLTPYGPWYANEVSSIEDFIESIQKIKNIDANLYITSHGERLYDAETFHKKIERFERYFTERENHILEALKEGPATPEILNNKGLMYKKRLLQDQLRAYFGMKMIEKHLKRLEKEGKVFKDDQGLYHLS